MGRCGYGRSLRARLRRGGGCDRAELPLDSRAEHLTEGSRKYSSREVGDMFGDAATHEEHCKVGGEIVAVMGKEPVIKY